MLKTWTASDALPKGGTQWRRVTWVGCYREIKNPAALAEYAKPAGPAIRAGGGKFLARGGRVQAFDAGISERTVVVEFPSFEQALANL